MNDLTQAERDRLLKLQRETTISIGQRLKLITDIYDDGQDHHPPGYIGLRGDEVIVREVRHGGKGGERIYVSHEPVTDNAFLVYRHEFNVI